MSTPHDLRFYTLDGLRLFFKEKGFRDVLTPPVVENPGMEVHLHPFALYSSVQKKPLSRYLHTSPEFAMKELLTQGFDKIFTLTYCFRDEPKAQLHRQQFIMLEWYRTKASYLDIALDTQELVDYIQEYLLQNGQILCSKITESSWTIKTVQDLFLEFAGFDPLPLDSGAQWVEKIAHFCPELLTAEDIKNWPYEDLFFLVFLNLIEPNLKRYPKLIVKDYPAPLAALSQLSSADPRVCKRFELYLSGVEIANCFEEETSLEVLQERFREQAQQKKTTYAYDLPEPEEFYLTMKKGLPQSSGIALGVERLAGALVEQEPPFWN